MKIPVKTATSLLFVVIFLICSCAHKGAPGGAPEDKTSPVVISATPAMGALLVPTDARAEITLSEWINPQNLKRSVFISPALPSMNIEANGPKITIISRGKLLDSTTYVITLGTDIPDYRGNKLASAYTLSFSTGPFIDSCSIRGALYGQDGKRITQGFTIGAFLGNDTAEANPVTTIPTYISQVGSDGLFELQNMKPGTYRVFAFSDFNQNRKFEPGREKLAIGDPAITLSTANPKYEGLVLVPTTMDTAGLALTRASSRPGNMLLVTFSKPVRDSLAFNPNNYIIQVKDSTQQKEPLKIESVLTYPLDSAAVCILTSQPKSGIKYRIAARALIASDGTLLDSARAAADFIGNGRADTTGPHLASVFPDQRIARFFPGDTVRIVFDEPVQEPGLRTGFTLNRMMVTADTVDSAVTRDTTYTPVSGSVLQAGPFIFTFLPDSLAPGSKYQWTIDPQSLLDRHNNASSDSILRGVFTVFGDDDNGSLSGTVKAADPSRCRVAVFSMQGKKEVEFSPEKNGYFLQTRVPEGSYRIFAYQDKNGNRKYDVGSLRCLSCAEQLVVGADSVYVRKQWAVEGIEITVP